MKNFKRILVLVIMVMASVISFTACGNPYKGMNLQLDDGGFENVLDRSYRYAGEDLSISISASVLGAGKGVSTDVVYTIQDKNLISAGEKTVEGLKTTQEFLIKGTGETYITVSSAEGNLRKDIKIRSYAPATGMSFVDSDIPLVQGQTTDITKVSAGLSKALLTFEPSYATEKDVILQATNGRTEISSSNVLIEGSNVTVSSAFDNDFVLVATLKGTNIIARANVRVLKPINENEIMLGYTSAYEDSQMEGGKLSEIRRIDSSLESGIDYQLYLADQSAGDQVRDAKNIYLIREYNGNYAVNQEYSFSLKSSNGKNTVITNTLNSGYSISNGNGVDNSDLYYFNVNYKGYESFFTGITLCVKVTISTFPTGIVINTNSDITNIETQNTIYVFNNYQNMAGTAFYVKLCNAGGFISNQYAYVNVWDNITGTNATLGGFAIYDQNGDRVIPGITKVKSGTMLSIRYDSSVINEQNSDYILYAMSAIDSGITTLKSNEAGAYDYNNLKLIKDYTLSGMTDVTLELNSGVEQVKLPIDTADSLPYEIFDVMVGGLVNLSLVTDQATADDNGYYISSKTGELGQTYYTVVAPNGQTGIKNIFVTKAVSEATVFELKVGGYKITQNGTVGINMDISKSYDVSLIIDGVEYKTLPPKYRIVLEHTGTACTYEGWQKIKSLKTPSLDTADKFVFNLTYTRTVDGGEKTDVAIQFTLNVQVVKPIKSITPSNSRVELLSNDIAKIDYLEVDKNGYLDISDRSSKTIYYVLNPNDASIATIKTENGTYLVNLSTATFTFEYGSDYVVSVPINTPYSKFDDYSAGSMVYYNNERYVYIVEDGDDWSEGEWYLVTNYGRNIVTGEDTKRALAEQQFTFRYYVEPTIGVGGDAIDITFNWSATVENNKIVLAINNVVSSNIGANGESFVIRLSYMQEYIASPKIYYIRINEKTGDYELTEDDADTAPAVDYIAGAFKVTQDCFITNGSNLVAIKIAGVRYPITNFAGTRGSFEYTKYAIQVGASTIFNISKPAKTDSITLIGANRSATNSGYEVSLNGNQIHNGDMFGYKYLAVNSLGKTLEKSGLIITTVKNGGEGLQESISNTGYYISCLDYDINNKLLGVRSNAVWENVTGLGFYIDFEAQRINFTIKDVNKFSTYLGNATYSKTLYIASLDTVMDSERTSVSFTINLRTGTSTNPYEIYDATTLQNVNLALGDNTYYVIKNDISLQGVGTWVPIGISSTSPFKAHITTDKNQTFNVFGFNGTLSTTGTGDYADVTFSYLGIFGYVGVGAQIENLTFKNNRLNITLDNSYQLGELYVGTVAGYIASGAILNNIKVVDSESVNYNNYGGLKNIAAENFARGITFTNVDNVVSLNIYVGGVAGYMGSSLNDLVVYQTINIADNHEKHNMYVGGAFGKLEAGAVVSGEFGTILKSTNKVAQSNLGGVAGWSKGSISNSTVVTYIYSNGGYNLGGVFGRFDDDFNKYYGNNGKAKDKNIGAYINNVEVTPMVFGAGKAQYVGGVVGTMQGIHTRLNNLGGVQEIYPSDPDIHYIANVKVKFVDRGCENSIFNSSVVGYNFVGGIIGRACEGVISISYSSVFSYVNREINMGYSESADASGYYYGDIIANASLTGSAVYVGGFIGGHDDISIANVRSAYGESQTLVSSVYYDANIRVLGGAKIGGVIGNFIGSNYKITDATLTGNIFYTQNYSYEGLATPVVSYVGNFIGSISNVVPTNLNKYFNDTTFIQKFTSVKADDFNIVNSYSLLKAKDLSGSDDLDYIKNFVGAGENYTFVSTDGNSMEVKVDYLTVSYVYKATGVFAVSYYTIDGEHAGTVDITAQVDESDSSIYIVNLGGIPTRGVESKGGSINFSDNVWKANFKISDLTVDTVATIRTDIFQITATTRLNAVWALNSFYMGYKADMFVDAGISTSYTFNETDFVKSVGAVSEGEFKNTVDIKVEDVDYSFNYFNNFGFDNFIQPNYGTVSEIIFGDGDNNTFLGVDNAGWVLQPNTMYGSNDTCTGNLHTSKYTKTYVYEGTESGVLNNNSDTLDAFTKYQNRELLDGNAIALKKDKLVEGKPDLVVSVAPDDIIVEVKDEYVANTDERTIAILKASDESIRLKSLVQITPIPAMASDEVIYSSSDENVMVVSGNDLVLKGEGVATLTVISALNSRIQKQITVIVVYIDRNNLNWQLSNANGTGEYTEKDADGNLIIDIVANDGLTLTTLFDGKGTLTYGMEYIVDLSSVSTLDATKKDAFLKNFTIGGKKLDANKIETVVAGGSISEEDRYDTIECSGLQHAVFCNVLGSIKVVQKLYFVYTVGGVEYKCYIFSKDATGKTQDSKSLKLNFNEGVFDISGSEELSFVVVNKSNFIVALNCDSNSFDIGFTAILGDQKVLINNIVIGEEIILRDYSLGQLIVKLESVEYDDVNKLKTFKFSAYVDDEGQKAVNGDLEYTLQFFAKAGNTVYDNLTHDVHISISQQQVESLNVTHYTNMLYTSNTVPTNGSDSYKYSSNIIIPGYTSLLQVDFYPSFGFFDYVEVTTSNPLLNLNQVVEALNMEGKSIDYSWYENYTEHVVRLANGIRVRNKYSTRDYNETLSAQFGYNGSLFFAMFADQSLADKNVQITITGYKDGVEESLFTTTVTLGVEARPNISINARASEVVFGGMVDLDIKVEYTTESFSASLKSTTSDAELIGSLADLVYSTSRNSYVLVVRDTRYTYINYSQYMYQDLVLKVTVSKIINGVQVTAEKSVNIRLVPFIIDSITVDLEGATQDDRNYVVSYYQAYNMVIKLNTTYSQGYYNYLLSANPTNSLNVQIASLEAYIAKNVKNYSMFSQGVEGNTKKLLTPNGGDSYSGEIAVNYDSEYGTTSVRFISASVSDFIWAEVGINYTSAGIELANVNFLPEYIFTYNFAVVIDTSSADDHPEPITSVNDLRNMREGVSYILLKDLLLANWTPIDGNFKVFDGNGYVITILSFANIESNAETTNIGIFNSISEGTVVKNLTIEVMPFANINFTEKDYESSDYSDKVNTAIVGGDISTQFANGLNIDISHLTNVNFGLLAGENLGTITNVNIIDNASYGEKSLRTERDAKVNSVSDSKRIVINYGDNFATAIEKLTKDNGVARTDTKTIKINTKKENETTAKNDNIGVLVGSNEGFITNSSVERINIESQEYVGGLVGYNAKNAKISSSYFKDGDITHNVAVREGSGVGGFVARNAGTIAYSYVYGGNESLSASGYSNNGLHAGGKSITTSGFAGGFVYENTGTISNSYANIWVKGAGAGFAYKNETETSVIEYCYSLSSMKINDSTTYPFTNKNMASSGILNKGTIKDCFYLYNSSYVNMSNDAGVSLEADDFSDYNAFVAYAFNADYNLNNEILDAVWYIPSGSKQNESMKSGVGAKPVPQLVSANLKTLSIRYLIQDQTDQYAFTYNYATPIGTVTNPILVDSSETFNKTVLTNKSVGETRNFRIINDISYNTGDEISNTNNAIFKGKLDGNGMTLSNLRLSSDGVNTSDSVTKLGLFATITGRRVEGVQEYAVVKNLNINISQIDGINVNVVGVLAGEISDARIYNIVIDGDDIVVQGLNAVGAVAGIVYGDTDLVNLSSSVSVSANYFANYNPFDYTTSFTQQQGNFDSFVRKNTLYDVDKNNITSVSYAGGIAGICNIIKRDPTSVTDLKLSSLYSNLYRARRLYLTGTPTISGEVVGGIFGYLSENANMSDCEITVSSGMHLQSTRVVGGLVGHSLGEIKRSTIENDNQAALDALVSKNTKTYDNPTSDVALGVEDMYGADNTSYRAMFAGGLIGFMQEGKLLNSYNRVTVNSKNSLYAGGIIGLSIGGTILDSVYTTASVYSYVGYGGVFGYVTDKLGEFFFTTNITDSSPISLTNVVASNIWKFSHLNINRKNELSPNAQDAYIGMLVGKNETKENVDIFNKEKADNIANRVNYEMVYYKQTYSYKSITGQLASMTIIPEIGNKSTTAWFKQPELNADGTSSNDGAYNGRYEYLNIYSSVKTGSFGSIDATKNNKTKFFVHSGTGLASGLYRSTNIDGNEDSNKIYLFSRMAQYGSLRSLQEFINRRNSTKEADDFYKTIGYTSAKEQDISSGLENNIYGFVKIEESGTTYYTKKDVKFSFVNIYENWDDMVWRGTKLNSDGTLTDSDCVFPALKNSLDVWTDVYVYSEKDLMDLTTKNTSNFILMNDIYLSSGSGNWCSVDKPFRGTIRSAKVGDIDGGNVVQYNFKFTIFNLDYHADSSVLNSDMAIGGLVSASDGASFENFNIHVVGLGVKDANSVTAKSKTTAMGVLVGRANGLTTIKNVQIIGFGERINTALSTVTKSNWASVTGLGATSKEDLRLLYAWSATKYMSGGKSIFETEDGSKKPAVIEGTNFEFMGGYIGVASNVDLTASDGTVYKLTGEVRIINDSNYTDEKSALVHGVSGGEIVVKDDSNEYISKCQVKNLTFKNTYYGTRLSSDAEVSVVSYIGGYFGLANVLDLGTSNEEHEALDFEAYDITIDYDLNVNNVIPTDPSADNAINKVRYEDTVLDRGIYLGSIAGQIKSVENINVNYAISKNSNIKITKSISNTAVVFLSGNLYAGSFGKLDNEIQFNHIIVDGFELSYDNGTVTRMGFTVNTNIDGIARIGSGEYIGSFAGYVGSAVTYAKNTSDAITNEKTYIGTDYVRYDAYDIAVNDVKLTLSHGLMNADMVEGIARINVGGVAGYIAEYDTDETVNMVVATVQVKVNDVKNINLGGAIGTAESHYSSTFADEVERLAVYSIKVLGVDFTGTLKCVNPAYACYIGGIIGYNSLIKNKETLAEGTIDIVAGNVGHYYIGGLYGCIGSGFLYANALVDITSLVDVYVSAIDARSSSYIGGIVGFVSSFSNNANAINRAYSYSNLFVSVDNTSSLSSIYVGGLAGFTPFSTSFANSYMFGAKKVMGLSTSLKMSQQYFTNSESNMFGNTSPSYAGTNNYYNYSIASISSSAEPRGQLIKGNADNYLLRPTATFGFKYQSYLDTFCAENESILKDGYGRVKYYILSTGSKINPVASSSIIDADYKSVFVNINGTIANLHKGITIYGDSSTLYNVNSINISNSIIYRVSCDNLTVNNSLVIDSTVTNKYNAKSNSLFINGVLGKSLTSTLSADNDAFVNRESIVAFSKINLSASSVLAIDYSGNSVINECEVNVNGSVSFISGAKYIDSTMINCTFKTSNVKQVVKTGVYSGYSWMYNFGGAVISQNYTIMSDIGIDYKNRFFIIDNEIYVRMVYGNWRDQSIKRGNFGDDTKAFITTTGTETGFIGTGITYKVSDAKSFAYAVNRINTYASTGSGVNTADFTIEFTTTVINLKGKIFDPIKLKSGFSLTIKGHQDGTRIIGLNIVESGYGGLILQTYDRPVNISNLRIEDSYIYGKSAAGALIGYQPMNSVVNITKVAVENTSIYSGKISGKDDGCQKVGSLIGYKECWSGDTSTITNCYTVTDQAYGSSRLIVPWGGGTTSMSYFYGLIGYQMYPATSCVSSFISNVNCVYMGLFDFETKKLISGTSDSSKTRQFAIFASDRSNSYDAKGSADLSIPSKASVLTIDAKNISKYQGETGADNFIASDYKFYVEGASIGHWEVNTSLSTNYGLPKIHFNTPYWCDLTEAVTPSGDVYNIYNEEQLAWVALQTNSGNTFGGKTIKLQADLQMQDAIWVPMGDSSGATLTFFAGTFDGNGHTISNLYSEGYCESGGKNKNTSHAAFMNRTMGATIKDVSFDNIELVAQNVAGVVNSPLGGLIQSVNVSNAKFKFTGNAGGIVLSAFGSGVIFNSTISNATFENKNSSANGYAGGIIGNNMSYTKVLGSVVTSVSYSSISSSNMTLGLVAGRAYNSLIQNTRLDGIKAGDNYKGTFGYIVGQYGDNMKIFETNITIPYTQNTADGAPSYNLLGKADSTEAMYNIAVENVYITQSGGGVLGRTEDAITSYVAYNTEDSTYKVKGYNIGGVKDNYWDDGSASWYINRGDTKMYDYYGELYTANSILKAKWYISEIDSRYIDIYNGEEKVDVVSPDTTKVVIKNPNGHDYVREYATFRASNNRVFDIEYNLDAESTFDYKPIGVYPYEFGSLTGNKVINITSVGKALITRRQVVSNLYGLFGNLYKARVTGLEVKYKDGNTAIDVGSHSGVIVNRANLVKFENCKVIGDGVKIAVTSRESTAYLGGILGNGTNVNMINCSVTGFNVEVTSDTGLNGIGGIAGYIYKGYVDRDVDKTSDTATTNALIEGCKATDCSIISTSTNNVGGIVGRLEFATITSCQSSATVIGVSNVGGIVGRAIRCYLGDSTGIDSAKNGNINLGVVSGNTNVGGIIGYADECYRINYSVNGSAGTNDAEVLGVVSTGGIVGLLYNTEFAVTIEYNINYAPINSSAKITSDYKRTGGIVGRLYGGESGRTTKSRTFANNTVLNNVNGYENVGGIIGLVNVNNVYLGQNIVGYESGEKTIYISGGSSVAGFVGNYKFPVNNTKYPLVFSKNKLKNTDVFGYNTTTYLLANTYTTVFISSGSMDAAYINISENGITSSGISTEYFDNWRIVTMVPKVTWALFNASSSSSTWRNYAGVGTTNIYSLYGHYTVDYDEFVMNSGNSSFERAGSVMIVKYNYTRNGRYALDVFKTSDGTGTPSETVTIIPLEYAIYEGESYSRRVKSFEVEGGKTYTQSTVAYCSNCKRYNVAVEYSRDISGKFPVNRYRCMDCNTWDSISWKLKPTFSNLIKPGYYYGNSRAVSYWRNPIIYVLANGNIVLREYQYNSDSRNTYYYEGYDRLSLLEPVEYDSDSGVWTYRAKYGRYKHGTEAYSASDFKFTVNGSSISYARILRWGLKNSDNIYSSSSNEKMVADFSRVVKYSNVQINEIMGNFNTNEVETIRDGVIKFYDTYYYRILSTSDTVYYASESKSEEFLEMTYSRTYGVLVYRYYEPTNRFVSARVDLINNEKFSRVYIKGSFE